MAQGSLGYITPGVAGPVRATSNNADPTLPVWCHKYRVWQVDNNTGRGYVGNANMIFATGDGLFGWVPVISIGLLQVPFYESEPVERQQNPIDLAQIYIDADNGADSFLVTYVEA